MTKNVFTRKRSHERGQTMIFVAISIVSLLALAALAIDIVTLYVARSEIQRAADAAALAGAKAIADSGFTTLPASDGNYANAQALAQTMATASINAMITNTGINLVGGQPPLSALAPAFDFTTHPGSYQVKVSLKSVNLPTFFSKIWSRAPTLVTASATAEAYNPANLSTITPIALKSLKPWLVANADPTSANLVKPPFINSATGAVEAGVIGKQFNLTADCPSGSPSCSPLSDNPPKVPSTSTLANPQVDYVPATVSPINPKNVCPSCVGATDYEQSIACADANAYAVLSCGGGATQITWDNGSNPAGATGLSASGAECLTGASAAGQAQGQDTLINPAPLWPSVPFQIKAGSHSPQNGNFVTTSNSIVTIPIIDNGTALTPPSSAVTVVGFMQAFINQVQDGTGGTTAGDINITVLNISGCSLTNNGASPVVGGTGTSPIPVRLITSP